MSNLSPPALALSQAYGAPDPGVDWERVAKVVDGIADPLTTGWRALLDAADAEAAALTKASGHTLSDSHLILAELLVLGWKVVRRES